MLSHINLFRFWNTLAKARASLWLILLVLAAPRPMLEFEADAGASLQKLWRQSVVAGREHVACIGGYQTPAGLEIDRIRPLDVSSDSLSADAALSLELCGPPTWLGTVHTHPHDSPLFKDTFSPSDRAVLAKWRDRWQADGAFCVLHSGVDAFCTLGTEDLRVKYASSPTLVADIPAGE